MFRFNHYFQSNNFYLHQTICRNGQHVRTVRGCVNCSVNELLVNQLGSHCFSVCRYVDLNVYFYMMYDSYYLFALRITGMTSCSTYLYIQFLDLYTYLHISKPYSGCGIKRYISDNVFVCLFVMFFKLGLCHCLLLVYKVYCQMWKIYAVNCCLLR